METTNITVEEFLKVCNGFVNHCIDFQHIKREGNGVYDVEDIYSECYAAIIEFFDNNGGIVEYPLKEESMVEMSAMINARLRKNILSQMSMFSIPCDLFRKSVSQLSKKQEGRDAVRRARLPYVPISISNGEEPNDEEIGNRYPLKESMREHVYYSHLDFFDEGISVAESQVLYETFGYGEDLSSATALALFKVFENITPQEREAFRLYEEGYSEKESGERVGLGEKWLSRLKRLIKKAIEEK